MRLVLTSAPVGHLHETEFKQLTALLEWVDGHASIQIESHVAMAYRHWFTETETCTLFTCMIRYDFVRISSNRSRTMVDARFVENHDYCPPMPGAAKAEAGARRPETEPGHSVEDVVT
eukprot:6209547-Pleurochrysis_carterae.AAC.2